MLLLAACADEPTSAEKKAADDRAVAQVEAVQKQRPPPRRLEPEPILFGDIQRFNLFGAGCAFAPGGSMGAVLLTREKVAYLKLSDRLVRFASDPGSAKLPLGTVSRYVGKEFAASLTRSDGENGEAVRFAGHLTITNPFDQVVYDADGLIQCGA
jgi:hypothetical protein